jgi:cytochrome c553
MKIIFSIIVIVLLSITISCKHVVQYDCTGITPTYTENIEPILRATCTNIDGCHGDNGEGDNLATYAGASEASKKKSFMGSIQHKPFYEKMPKDADRLTDTQIHLISCWIENGSPQ